MLSFFGRANASTDISHEDLASGAATGALAIVDVREHGEFVRGHIAGAINVPLSRFDPARIPKDRPVALICLSGARSASALRELERAGYANVRHYRPGMSGWVKAGGACV